MNKVEAQEKINELVREMEKIEAQIVDIALEYEISVYLGDYGTGRYLLLSDDPYSGMGRGEWLPSSMTC